MKYIKKLNELQEYAASTILKDIKLKLNSDLSYEEFKNILIELHKIGDEMLDEDDEEVFADIQDNLNKTKSSKYLSQIEKNEGSINLGTETLSEYASWLRMIGW